MSNNNLQFENNESNIAVTDDDALERQSSSTVTSIDLTPNVIYDKQQSLVEIANNTFRELCKTLENEQAKLLELEERRKKLQEEMKLLKAEIEEEKESYKINIVQSVADNLSALNKACDEADNQLDLGKGLEERSTIPENFNIEKLISPEDDEYMAITARNIAAKNSRDVINDKPTIEEETQHIRNELQSVLTECIIEQCTDKRDVLPALDHKTLQE